MIRKDKKKSGGQNNFRDHTLIASSARVVGDIEFSGGLHIQGEVEGNIAAAADGGQLVIGETGVVRGEIRVPRITINGRVEGDVNATEHLELASKAQIEGNVFYVIIEMLMGSRVNGKLVRLDDERRNLPAPEKPGQTQAVPDPGVDAGLENS